MKKKKKKTLVKVKNFKVLATFCKIEFATKATSARYVRWVRIRKRA